MGRWEPDARDRLERAALELFGEHGFDAVTVPEITARAGLTTRTFFRHFADKREVLFADADQMPIAATRLVLDAPPGLEPIAVVAQGLPMLASAFEGRLTQLKQRKAVINGHDGLRERELRKMEGLVDAIAEAFRRRGVDDLTAGVVAETAVGVVKVALGRWIESDGREPLVSIMTDSLDRIGAAFDQFTQAADRSAADPDAADPDEADPDEADPDEADPDDADPDDADPDAVDPDDGGALVNPLSS